MSELECGLVFPWKNNLIGFVFEAYSEPPHG